MPEDRSPPPDGSVESPESLRGGNLAAVGERRPPGCRGFRPPWRACGGVGRPRGGAEGRGQPGAAGGSAVAGESHGRESASGVAPTDAVTPSPLSAPEVHARCRVGCMARRVWRVASYTPWCKSLAQPLAHSVASVAPLSPAEHATGHAMDSAMECPAPCPPCRAPPRPAPSAPRISPAGYLACSAPICLALAVRAELGEQRASSLCLLS